MLYRLRFLSEEMHFLLNISALASFLTLSNHAAFHQGEGNARDLSPIYHARRMRHMCGSVFSCSVHLSSISFSDQTALARKLRGCPPYRSLPHKKLPSVSLSVWSSWFCYERNDLSLRRQFSIYQWCLPTFSI